MYPVISPLGFVKPTSFNNVLVPILVRYNFIENGRLHKLFYCFLVIFPLGFVKPTSFDNGLVPILVRYNFIEEG